MNQGVIKNIKTFAVSNYYEFLGGESCVFQLLVCVNCYYIRKKKHGIEYLIDHLLYLELCCHPALRLINNGNLNYRSILKSSFRIKASGDEKEGRDQSLQ